LQNGKVVGQGFFQGPGKPHAEVNAIASAGQRARGATLILNLEPCCHYGLTPPCTEAIIRAGIRRVVAGMKDPNPLVNGKGFRALRRAGIEVITGLLEAECKRFNEVFVKYITTKTPFVILKAAVTLDGRIADRFGKSNWITGPEARACVHRLRDIVDVVMVGAGTVLADDPRLTVRLAGKGRNPRPLIVDSRIRVSAKARVFNSTAAGGAMVATTAQAEARKRKLIRNAGAEILIVRKDRAGRVDLKALMRELGTRKIASVLMEGGAELFTSALENGIVDKMILFFAPRLLLDGKARSMACGTHVRRLEQALKIRDMQVKRVGADFMVIGYPGR